METASRKAVTGLQGSHVYSSPIEPPAPVESARVADVRRALEIVGAAIAESQARCAALEREDVP
jgi:hypothetical protein